MEGKTIYFKHWKKNYLKLSDVFIITVTDYLGFLEMVTGFCICLLGLSELGAEVIKVFILPKVKSIADRIDTSTEGSSLNITDKIAAGHIKHLLVVSKT